MEVLSRLYRPIVDSVAVELMQGLVLAAVGGRISVVGELDFSSGPSLRAYLAGVDGDIEVDCSGLTFVDSAGLRVLEEAHRTCEAAGVHLSLIDPPHCLSRLVHLSRLDGFFEIRDGSRS